MRGDVPCVYDGVLNVVCMYVAVPRPARTADVYEMIRFTEETRGQSAIRAAGGTRGKGRSGWAFGEEDGVITGITADGGSMDNRCPRVGWA